MACDFMCALRDLTFSNLKNIKKYLKNFFFNFTASRKVCNGKSRRPAVVRPSLPNAHGGDDAESKFFNDKKSNMFKQYLRRKHAVSMCRAILAQLRMTFLTQLAEQRANAAVCAAVVVVG